MKKLYFFLLAFMLFGGGIAFAYSDDGNPHLTEGSNGSPADPVRVYQLVRYPVSAAGSSTTISTVVSQGDVVGWDCISADGVTVNQIGSINGTSADSVAGIVISATITGDQNAVSASADVGHKNWGYIQTYGLNTYVKITGKVNFAGQAIGADIASQGYAKAIDQGAPVNQTRLGFAYATQTSTTATGIKAFVNTR